MDLRTLAADACDSGRQHTRLPGVHLRHADPAAAIRSAPMIAVFFTAVLQLLLLLAVAPLVSGLIRTLKARFQVRRGPDIVQPYRDLYKLFRKGMVLPDTASWIFAATPYVVFGATAIAGLMIPMISAKAPLGLFGGVLAVVYLLGLGPARACCPAL